MLQRNTLETRTDFLCLLRKNTVGVEIGVFKGSLADEIIRIVEPKKLFLIDPWVGKIHSGDKDGNKIELIENGDVFYETEILPKYSDFPNVEVIRNTSGILRKFEDGVLDWAYVDGNHSYLGVTHDLEILRNKVKKDGIIMGHDYKAPRYFSVVKAVNDFCRKYNLNIDYLSKDRLPSYFIINR